MAHPHNFSDGARHGGGRTLAVVSAGDDSVEKFSSLAELHHEVHVLVVLVGSLELHDVGMLRKRGHDSHLAPHVLDVHGGPKLPLRDRFAGQRLLGFPVRAEVGDAELAPAQFPAQYVLIAYARPVAHWNHVLQNADRCRRPPRFVRKRVRFFLVRLLFPGAVAVARLLAIIFHHISFRTHVTVSHTAVL
ncbi:hypothetical protein V8G54_006460 [Vigna mungo]|uniref:Uncharacterized protein n=1 Tax=Vigna mungo TaxID=3915 RepID=A0AAQ3P0I9_VIGMU